MARISVRTALIGLGGIAVAGASWVSADQPVPAIPLAAPAISAPALATISAPVPAPTKAVGKPGVVKNAPKSVGKPSWGELSSTQQAALMPLAAEWDKIEGLRRQKWLEVANHYASMKPDEQQRVHERMRDWIKLTPEQRRLVRENYARSKKIEPGKKSEQWEEYQQLPEDQKKKLAAEAATKRPLANLPPPSQGKIKTIAPIKSGAALPIPAAPPAAVAAGSTPTLPPEAASPIPLPTPASVPSNAK